MSLNAIFVRGTLAMLLIAADYIQAAPSGCTVTIAQKTVHSESKPRGMIKAIVITGAEAGKTRGGKATSEERCAYFYEPDVAKGSSRPTYTGSNWPYFKVGEGCDVVLCKTTIPADAKLHEPGFVSVEEGTRILHIGGLPVYQYDDDEVGVCYCNQPGEWTSINANGVGAAYPVTYPSN